MDAHQIDATLDEIERVEAAGELGPLRLEGRTWSFYDDSQLDQLDVDTLVHDGLVKHLRLRADYALDRRQQAIAAAERSR